MVVVFGWGSSWEGRPLMSLSRMLTRMPMGVSGRTMGGTECANVLEPARLEDEHEGLTQAQSEYFLAVISSQNRAASARRLPR